MPPGPSFPRKWLGCGSRPHQRVCEVVTPPAPTRTTQQRGLLSFISQLVFIQTNMFDGLVGFKGGGKSLSVLKTAACETCPGRRISPSYQLRSIFGFAEALLYLLLSYLLKSSKPITGTNCGTTYSNKIHWISMLSMILQTPPVGATRP